MLGCTRSDPLGVRNIDEETLMRLAVFFAITLCLPGIAIAQDAPEKKCGAVAYVNDGTFAGAFNYENCTDAEAEAIKICERIAKPALRDSCKEDTVLRRGGWLQVYFCKRNNEWDARVQSAPTQDELRRYIADWIRKSEYTVAQCTMLPNGLFNSDGEHASTKLAGSVQNVAPEPKQSWIAVVGGFAGNGRHVSVGFARRDTRDAAEAAALRSCNDYGPATCKSKDVFSKDSGCLYITPGSRRGGVTWGRGSTQETALSECREKGYTCPKEKLVGGCVE